MKGAAAQAHALANGITDIPDQKNIDIRFTSNYSQVQQQMLNLSNSALSLAAKGIGHALGGVIGGTGTGDTQPAMLTPGEFVVRKDGSNLADALKYFGAQGFAGGGPVGSGSGVVDRQPIVLMVGKKVIADIVIDLNSRDVYRNGVSAIR